MSSNIDKIKMCLTELPSKDIPIGTKFLEKRDFDSLKELVDSAIIRTKRNLRTEFPKQEYLDVDIDLLNVLKAEVDIYTFGLEVLNKEDDEYYDND